MKKERFYAVLLAATMISSVPILAEEWVRVSAWAYNDVSNFTNEGLLPECMEGVTDYLAPATLEQICEILFSVRERVLPGLSLVDSSILADGEIESVREIIYFDNGGLKENVQHPKEPITRAKVVTIFNDCYEMWMGANTVPFPKDVYYEGVTDRRSTYYAKLNGIMDASYEPSAYMTIEQAIVAAYRMYNKFPETLRSDGELIDGDGLIQTYSNGIEEHKQGNMLILKQNGVVIAEYETDVYKNIYCITLPDGRTIAATQHFLGHTDVYDLADGSVIATVPYETDSLTTEYIITKSQQQGGFTYGVSDYSGNTLLQPEYSMKEINTLKANGFALPEEQHRAADGWVYFIEEGTQYLYRVDTNGENEQLLAGRECYEFQYKDGYVYAILRTSLEKYTYELCRMKPDGTDMVQIADHAMLMSDSERDDNNMLVFPDCGNWLYYVRYVNDEWCGMRIKTDTPEILTEQIYVGDRSIVAMTEEHMYYQIPQNFEKTNEEGTFYKNLVTNTDIKVSDEYWKNVEIKDGKVYFDIYGHNTDIKEYVAPLGSKEYSELIVEETDNGYAQLNGGAWKADGEFYRTISKYTDEAYAVGYHATTSTKEYDDFNNRLEDWYYIDKVTGESYKLNMDANSMVKIRARIGNHLYITLSEKMLMLVYDMDKHEVTDTMDKIESVECLINGGNHVYTVEGAEWNINGKIYIRTMGNLMELDYSSLAYEHVYPSKGIYRYSKAACITEIRGEICKVDENGFWLRLGEHRAEQAMLVKN